MWECKELRLCILPNDPLQAYFDKGEIKERYYNPNNFFDEIHVISLIDKDVEESKVKIMVGSAKLKIHSVGKINIKNRNSNLERITELVEKIDPDVIRAYNPFVEGWLAAKCAKKLNIPFYLSLHTHYDYNRKLVKKRNLKKFCALKYTEKYIEPLVLENADKISIVFKVIESYVKKHSDKKPEWLYNKIDFNRFANTTSKEELKKPLILSVGNLIETNKHKLILEAMKSIEANCLIIGNGELFDDLKQFIKKNKLENKVKIEKSVSHNEIQQYYKSASVFALAFDPYQEGLPMPIMEAMASGLPVVIPFPKKDYSDGLENIAVFSKRDAKSFSGNINKLLNDESLRQKFVEKSMKKAKEFDIVVLEKREEKIYHELLKNE